MRTISSPLSSNAWSSINLLTNSDNSTSSSLVDVPLMNTESLTSDQQSPINFKDSEDNPLDINNKEKKKIATDIVSENMNTVTQKKKIIPALDQFAAKKQKTMGTVENVLSQSSHALNVMATAYLNRTTATQQQHHPYITAIAEAMKRVPDEKQLSCFMSIMQIILNHETSDSNSIKQVILK
ncbi:uncharacterized protein [Mycetomoellerius zeteki]|uniref:uncharacterized protein n=1 Tax=Mycetomoellerius zeteki TaxID=64791 RepID=UPI00084E6D47|nr:PREDICTED: uncharacterized protein LOC108723881 [Trachymyrmex zeteki]